MHQDNPSTSDKLFRIRILGTPTIIWRDQSTKLTRRQARGLIYYLADTMGPISRDRLCFLFWPDIPEAEARRNLSRLLSLIRGDLPQNDLLLVSKESISLNPNLVWSDAAEFSRLSEQPSPMAKEAAVDLYQGAFLDGYSLPQSPEYDLWISTAGARYERIYLSTLAELIISKKKAHDLISAIQYAQSYLAVDEVAEDIHRLLITIYAANNDQAAAMRQFEICTLALERELGVEPLPETRAAFEAAQSGEVSLQPALKTKPAWTVLPSLDLPLIGQEEAWESLENAYHRFQNGGLIFISGEPGIGKSRLLQEFATSRNRVVLSGNCHASTQILPYQPLVQALRQALSLPELWEDIRPIWLTETSRLLPELGDHFPDLPQPIDVEPDQAQARLFEALTQCALGLAAKAPLLLCLDDTHWVDEATLGWLIYLSGRLASSGLCILSTYRVEEISAVADLRGSFSRVNLLAEIPLSGLSAGAIGQVLESLPQPPPQPGTLADQIYGATGGNAFFILETIRNLLESDLLASPPIELPLADTVQGAIQRRLDRLSPVARQVLEAAAILSPNLDFKLLQETAGRSALELADGLDELLSHQLLTNGDRHRFRHDLIQQVTYLGLSPWRRQLLHHRAAKALEEFYRGKPDELAAQIAQHYDAAGESERAIHHYKQAAVTAQRLYAHKDAITHLRRAIELAKEKALEPVDSAQLYESLADSLEFTGQYAEAEDNYMAASNHTPREEHLWRADLGRKLASTIAPQHRYDEAVAAYKTALTILGDLTPQSGQWQSTWLDIQLGLLDGLYMQNRPDEMATVSAEIRHVLDTVGTADQRADYYIRLGMMKMRQERYRLSNETLSLKIEALAYARETGNLRRIARNQFSLGFTMLWSGDLNSAAEQLTASLAKAEDIGHILLQDQCLVYLVTLYRLLGQVERARSTARRSLQIAQQVDTTIYIAAAHANLAWLDWRDQELVAAERKAQKALTLWGEFPYPFKWMAFWVLIAIDLDRRQLAGAVESGKAMLHPAQQRLPDDVTTALERAVESWEDGRVESARNDLQRALDLAEQRGYL